MALGPRAVRRDATRLDARVFRRLIRLVRVRSRLSRRYFHRLIRPLRFVRATKRGSYGHLSARINRILRRARIIDAHCVIIPFLLNPFYDIFAIFQENDE